MPRSSRKPNTSAGELGSRNTERLVTMRTNHTATKFGTLKGSPAPVRG